MQYKTAYPSPLGEIVLTADGLGLTGLRFAGGKDGAPGPGGARGAGETPVFARTKRWLDLYFSGKKPDFTPPIHMTGTPFQLEVWELLRRIPYGKTATYGELAGKIAQKRGLERMSAQAVGGAVGRNPVSILVPCHRVVGKDGSLTGYAGGVDRKAALLRLERAGDAACVDSAIIGSRPQAVGVTGGRGPGRAKGDGGA